MERICQCPTAYYYIIHAGWHSGGLAGENYNNFVPFSDACSDGAQTGRIHLYYARVPTDDNVS